MIFGEDGLKPGIVKMFFDPFQQEEPGGPFDHERTTRWMRYFVRERLERAFDALALVTAHGFGSADAIRSTGINLLRTFRPELHVELMGFAGNGTGNADAVVVLSTVRWGSQPIRLRVLGNDSASFHGYLTTGDPEKTYADQGSLAVHDGWITFDLPARSAMTLFAE